MGAMVADIHNCVFGSLDALGLFGAFLGMLLALGSPFLLFSAIRNGRILDGFARGVRQRYVERSTSPIRFWILFILYALIIPAGIALAIIACFARRPLYRY